MAIANFPRGGGGCISFFPDSDSLRAHFSWYIAFPAANSRQIDCSKPLICQRQVCHAALAITRA